MVDAVKVSSLYPAGLDKGYMAIGNIPKADAFVLRNCSVPTTFLAEDVAQQEGDIVVRDIHVASGKIVAITRSDAGYKAETESPSIDVARAMIWPCFADLHCHLDKGQISDRAPGGNGTFVSALEAVASDRVHWNGVETR